MHDLLYAVDGNNVSQDVATRCPGTG
jgi:hypothetical protein